VNSPPSVGVNGDWLENEEASGTSDGCAHARE
jgi:hypothetical protein